jgi:hypothetical protein
MFKVYGWQPGIGDPSVMGWVTVGAYFLTALIALRLVLISRQRFPADTYRAQQRFWLIVCLLMLVLGINKQLDLQSLITEMGRYYAACDGWLEHKRYVQVGVIISMLFLSSLSLLFFFLKMRSLLKTNWLAIAGLSFLMVFIVTRATSFHHMDMLINTYFVGVRANWLFELGGLAAVILSALLLGKEDNVIRLK